MKLWGKRAALGCGVAAIALICASTAWAQTKTFDIPAEEATNSIPEFANQAGIQIIAPGDQLKEIRTPAVKGALDVHAALAQLLAGTKLEVGSDDGQTILLRTAPKNVRAASNEGAATATISTPEEVLVTGTHIRGLTDSSSPVRTLDRLEIDKTGATTVQGLFATVPEVFQGGTTTATATAGIGAQNGQSNRGYTTGVNLRGLGSDSTLVLLDGFRLPESSNGFSVDISAIPLAALDHVDILKDGASSIYGSDAVAGVVNFVTTRHFDGAETSITGGTVTSGGKQDGQFNQLFGKDWGTGNVLASYTYDYEGPLRTTDRAVTSTANQPSYVIPQSVQNSAFLSGNQAIGDRLTVDADVLFSDRAFDTEGATIPRHATSTAPYKTSIGDGYWITSAEAHYALWPTWTATLSGQYDHSDTHYKTSATAFTAAADLVYKGGQYGGEFHIDGNLLSLPGGDAKLAAGAAIREESYALVDNFDLSRTVDALYAEIFVPIVGAANSVPFIQRLEITGSDRWEHYSDFGSTNNPKIGILWMPTDGVTVKGTFSTSFRAPLLSELQRNPSSDADLLLVGTDAGSPTGTSLQIERIGGNPNLEPETAHSYTTGLDYLPNMIPGLTLGLDAFVIDFKNMIAVPNPGSTSIAAQPAVYGAFLTRNPSAALVNSITSENPLIFTNLYGPFSPSDVQLIADDRLHNLASVDLTGWDITALYKYAFSSGVFSVRLNTTHYLNYDATLVSTLPSVSRLNTPYYPTAWRVRATTGWDTESWSVSGTINYANSYTDNTVPTALVPVSSFTTFDLQLGYILEKATDQSGSGTRLQLTAQNLFDAQAPYLHNSAAASTTNFGYNYDPTNANALRRYISLELVRKW